MRCRTVENREYKAQRTLADGTRQDGTRPSRLAVCGAAGRSFTRLQDRPEHVECLNAETGQDAVCVHQRRDATSV